MEYRRFGRTQLRMPVISTGGMRYQCSWKREDPVKSSSIDNLNKIVAHSLSLGMNHFETAFGYGTSEEELGRVLSHIDRSCFLIQTKGEPKEDPDQFLKNVDTSLECLNLDYLDLFAIHGINNDDLLNLAQKPGGTLEQALKLKDQGVFRFLGFSSHAPTSTIIKAIETDCFDYVNLWFSYINQTNRSAIQAARDRDMGVFIISPNDKGGHLHTPSDRLRQLCAPLSPMAFNDLYILLHQDIHTISCGAARPEDLDEHAEAVARIGELHGTVKTIQTRLDQALANIHGPDWAENYTQGVPGWQDTPGQINIPVILWLWNLVQAFDMRGFAQARYNLIGNAEHWFPGRQADKLGDIDPCDLHQALQDSTYADRIIDILNQAHDLMGGKAVQRLSST